MFIRYLNKYINYDYWLGFLAIMSIHWPYLGKSVSVFGIQNRAIGLGLSLLTCVVGLRRIKFKRLSIIRGILIAIYTIIVFLHAAPEQWNEILNIQNLSNYYKTALASYVLISLPAAFIGFILSGHKLSENIGKGMLSASLLLAVIAVVNIYIYQEYFTQSWKNLSSFSSEVGIFSTISYSILLFFGLLSVMLVETTANKTILVKTIMICILVGFMFLMLQRTHILFSIVLLVIVNYLSFNYLSGKRMTSIIYFLFAALIMFCIVILLPKTTFSNAFTYFQGLLDGSALSNRMSYVTPILNDMSFIGNGVGTYSLKHSVRYPHNLFVHSIYEIGWGATLFLVVLSVVMLRSILTRMGQYLRDKNKTVTFISIGGLFYFIHFMKSGDIYSMGHLFFFMLLTPFYSKREIIYQPTLTKTVGKRVKHPAVIPTLQR